MIRRPPRSTQSRSSAASDVYKRQRTDDRADRQASSDGLPQHRQVRCHAVVFLRAAQGDPEGREHFVEEEQAPVPSLSLIHISEPTRLGMTSYAVFCLKKKNNHH